MSTVEKLKKLACDTIDSHVAELKKLSQDIWENPELAYNEKYAHKRLTDFLEERGFSVEREYVVPTAFRAKPKNGHKKDDGDQKGAKVALLCEYDALPEMGHACGHNLIATVGIAASLGIQAALASQDYDGNGELMVLGTPAEEGGGGKIDLIWGGAFQDVDVAMMAHPSQSNLPKPICLARHKLYITYRGKEAHASGHPWDGVNALDAAVLCYTNISHMRQQIHPTWRVHGVITNGGVKPNIIPAVSEMLYYLRAPTGPELEVLSEKVIGCIEGAAKATGCEVEYKLDPKSYAALMSNNTVASRYAENAENLGIKIETNKDKLTKAGGSTDMGNVSNVVPAIQPKFHIGTAASQHTPEFAVQSRTAEAEEYSLAVAKALAMTGIDFLTSPELVQQAKDDFAAAVKNKKAQSKALTEAMAQK
ncbi:hypothetical protein BaRGS_00021018 [Batillaria attramentaria]|uniref:Peptidase M20 domain-containing protein 2 n=1 Tax=Batillaria attramentaria TaxID=370345 RepID=A0ABD0KKK4_9CAEN